MKHAISNRPCRAGLLGLGALWLLAAGCGDDFRSAGELDESPQVLAIQATPPEVSPGERVSLNALLHWPQGDPTLLWLVCIPNVGDSITTCLANQFTEGTEPPLCDLAPPESRLCLAGIGPVANFDVPAGIFPDDGEQHTFFVNLLATDSFDGLAACGETLMGGEPTESCLLALKRVVVSYEDVKNVNPRISHLNRSGVILDPAAVETIDSTELNPDEPRIKLAVMVDALSVDELFPPDDDPAPFDMVASWFTTCGKFRQEKVFVSCDPGDAETAPFCEPAIGNLKIKTTGECAVHVVVRDGAGGIGYHTQRFEIR